MKNTLEPGRCGSVGWALSHKPGGCQFDSHRGMYLGCGFSLQEGACRRKPVKVSLSLPFSEINKNIFFFLMKTHLTDWEKIFAKHILDKGLISELI